MASRPITKNAKLEAAIWWRRIERENAQAAVSPILPEHTRRHCADLARQSAEIAERIEAEIEA